MTAYEAEARWTQRPRASLKELGLGNRETRSARRLMPTEGIVCSVLQSCER